MRNDQAIDATPFKEEGRELVAKIEAAVKGTQLFIIRELPNEVWITTKQFDSMMKATEGTSYMSAVTSPDLRYGAVKKAYIFYTPMNAMDVVIVDDERKNLPEAGEMKQNGETKDRA